MKHLPPEHITALCDLGTRVADRLEHNNLDITAHEPNVVPPLVAMLTSARIPAADADAAIAAFEAGRVRDEW